MALTNRQELLANPDLARLLAQARKPGEDAPRLQPQYRGKLAVTLQRSIRSHDDFEICYTPGVAAAVGITAIEQGLARNPLSRAELIDKAGKIIRRAQKQTRVLIKECVISPRA